VDSTHQQRCPASVLWREQAGPAAGFPFARAWTTTSPTTADAVAIALASRYNKTMKTLAEIRHILQAQKPYLAERYGVVELGVFGSYVRGEQRPDSDLDVLIELEKPPRISLIGLVELEYDLSEALGLKVDVALKKNLRKRIGQRILSEVIPI
jgi:predicted nucleotidyltransferase